MLISDRGLNIERLKELKKIEDFSYSDFLKSVANAKDLGFLVKDINNQNMSRDRTQDTIKIFFNKLIIGICGDNKKTYETMTILEKEKFLNLVLEIDLELD